LETERPWADEWAAHDRLKEVQDSSVDWSCGSMLEAGAGGTGR